MLGWVFLILTLTTLVCCTDSEGLISRCLVKRREQVFLNCPDNHVIYQPDVFLGVSRQSEAECVFITGDCTGLSFGLMKQKNKCYWQTSCSFGWRYSDVILKSNDSQCIGQKANYVAYTNAPCVHQDNVFSICDKKPITSTSGVVRSHEEYPWVYGTIVGKCVKTIEIRPGFKLKLTLDDVETQDGDYLLIKHKTGKSQRVVFNGTSSSGIVLNINTGSLTIEFMASRGAKLGRGFIFRFEKTKVVSPLVFIEPYVRDVAPNITDVYSTVEECINHKEELVHLSCPDDHVIYKTNIEVGSSNFDICYSSHGDCKGKVHTILIQENDCYWSNYCDITWSGRIPITMTTSPYCLAMMPTYVSLSKFQCIRKDSVVNICDRTIWEIKKTSGIIKSHETYPWNYKAVTATCRKRIRVNRKWGLRVYTDDFDLDFDTRKERVNIWHVSPSGIRSKKQKLRGQERTELVARDGCIDIEFKISSLSKAGRGFILKFENFLDNINSNEIYDNDVDDCGGKNTFFPKRPNRGKINGKIKRKKGRKHRKFKIKQLKRKISRNVKRGGRGNKRKRQRLRLAHKLQH